jgi:hypothetical protein
MRVKKLGEWMRAIGHPPLPRVSEGESSAELQLSSGVCCAGNHARRARRQRGARIAEIGVIQGVKGIHSNLEFVALSPQIERLTHGKIEQNLTGADDTVSLHVAERSIRRNREGRSGHIGCRRVVRRVVPLLDGVWRDDRQARCIRIQVAGRVGLRKCAWHSNRNWVATLQHVG